MNFRTIFECIKLFIMLQCCQICARKWTFDETLVQIGDGPLHVCTICEQFVCNDPYHCTKNFLFLSHFMLFMYIKRTITRMLWLPLCQKLIEIFSYAKKKRKHGKGLSQKMASQILHHSKISVSAIIWHVPWKYPPRDPEQLFLYKKCLQDKIFINFLSV